MVPVLAYEVPTYAEVRRQPRVVVNTLAVSMAMEVAIGGFALLMPGSGLNLAHDAWWLGTAVAALAALLVVCAAVHARTLVYSDRIETALYVGGLPVWRRRVPWGIVGRCDVRRRKAGDVGFKAWSRGPGLTVVMFAGDGVSLHLTGFAELVIGSADPDRLAAAIDAGRATAV